MMPGPWVNNTLYRRCQDHGSITHYTGDVQDHGSITHYTVDARTIGQQRTIEVMPGPWVNNSLYR